MNKNLPVYYLLPFIFIMAIPFLSQAFSEGGTNYIWATLFTILFPIILILSFRLKSFIFILISFPVLLATIIYDVMFFEYDTCINIGSWNSMINTDPREAKEFLQGFRLLTWIIVIIQVIAYLFYFFFSRKIKSLDINFKSRIIALVLFCFVFVDFSVRGASTMAFPLRGMDNFYKYFKVKKLEASYFETKRNAVFNAVRNKNYKVPQKETIVIVVGETLRRDHLEYYGYDKPTTPLMKKEDLLIFDDVISPANQTVNSLQRIFTLADKLDENDYWKYPSFIKAFKETGFKTYWLSTQQIYERAINEVSFIAKGSDTIIHKQPINFDATILKPYQKVLNSSVDKKLIIIHVLGNHAKYSKRYPKEDAFFSREKKPNSKINTINEYDDAVRYNDFILHEILSILKKQTESETSLIMFSDHGESLFESNPNHSYHGSDKPAQCEFDVPFIMWFSQTFKNNHSSSVSQAILNKDKSIILSDFFHAIPSFYGIEFEKLNPKNNFLGKYYLPKKDRKIVNGSLKLLDYNNLKGEND